MASFKFALLLGAVVTLLQCGCTSTLGAGEEQCTSGFVDFDSIDENSTATLPDSSLPTDDMILLSNFRRWIFPTINFTCDGYITSWTLRVNNSMPESMNTALIPQITTWRLQGSNFYRQQSITTQSQLSSQKIDTRLMFTPSPPGIPVQAEDIVGIRLPSVDDMLMIKPLFLRLNSSTISCAGLQGNSEFFFFDTVNQRCNGNTAGEEQSMYVPLISVNINTDIPSSVSPSPSATPPATTMAPSPPPTPQDSTDLLISTTMDLAAPPQPGADTGQLVGVIVGALVAVLSLVLIVILAIFLILLLTRRRSQKLYDVPVPPQPQTDFDSNVYSQIIDSQGIEMKNNEAYSPSTTQQIPTEDNVAYDQTTPQIHTEDNVAYGQAATSQLQITTEDNVA